MTQVPDENVEVVRRSAEAFLAGDIDSALTYFDPEGEFVSRFAAMEGRSYRGEAGVREYLADIEESWESFEREVEELVPAGEAVLAVLRIRAVSRGGRIPVEERIGLGYWVREGRIVRMVSYPSVAEARSAVGLGG